MIMVGLLTKRNFILLILTGLSVLFAFDAQAATCTVTTTADDNNTCDATCSLREGIHAANVDGNDTINFNIDTPSDPLCVLVTGICKISPASELPEISSDNVTIDGFTQPSASANTNAMGDVTTGFNPLNTVLKIVIDGTNA